MKKFIAVLTVMLVVMLPSPLTLAKSYSIDEVQIKGWIQPNGDMIVNEIFTYTFDGQFSKLTRSFPDRHHAQIDGFEAYLLTEKQPVVGEIKIDMLMPLNVTTDGETRITTIDTQDKTVSIFYVYIIEDAVKSYETYSDLDITFFDKGKNHDSDYKNVSIAYVLPGDVGDSNVHGFMQDLQGNPPSIYRNGIVFSTPNSQARSLTATRVLFPSFMMTEQQKGEAPVSLEAAIAQGTEWLERGGSEYSTYKSIIIAATLIFVGLAIVMLLFRQRRFALFGNAELVLEADPIYLFFVDRNGAWNSRSLLAGLFSLHEKGIGRVKMELSATRFRRQPDAPEKTFAFHLNSSTPDLLPYEQKMVTWLCKPGLTERIFHLHDVAGSAKGEKANKKRYQKQQHEFEDRHHEWYEEVEQLMREAGILSSRRSKMIQWGSLMAVMASMLVATYIVGGSVWEYAFLIIVAAVILIPFKIHPGKLERPVFFFALMLFSVFRLEAGDLKLPLVLFVLASVLLYYATPSSMITSWNARYMKMSMNKFRAQVKNGLPQNLSEDQQNRWLTRAYLLNRSTTKLPRLKGPIPTTLPLAALFTMTIDPLEFVRSTWGPSFYYGPSMGGGSGGSDGGYYYSGGGGGSSGGDGGGAGAE